MLAALLAVVALSAAIALTVVAYRRQWRWTGLPADPGDGTAANPPRPAKTLWDWLQLLVVPLVLAGAAFALNAAQSDRDRRQEESRAAKDRALEERRAARDRSRAEDRAREDTLSTYVQQMSNLIARHGVHPSGRGRPDTEALARTLTLVALRRLDGDRKGLVVQFLMDADLINRTRAWEETPRGYARRFGRHDSFARVRLDDADLRGAVMPHSLTSDEDPLGPDGLATVRAAVLDGADLRGADFRGRYLEGVTFGRADLRGADFTAADLGSASFLEACLSGAKFVRVRTTLALGPADFRLAAGSGVDFSNAALDGASFWGAALAHVTLTGASTRGVQWPRGWTSTGLKISDATVRRACNG